MGSSLSPDNKHNQKPIYLGELPVLLKILLTMRFISDRNVISLINQYRFRPYANRFCA